MTASLTVCPICYENLMESQVFNHGAIPAEVRTNGSLPVLASWRCSNKHEFVTVVVVSKVEEMRE